MISYTTNELLSAKTARLPDESGDITICYRCVRSYDYVTPVQPDDCCSIFSYILTVLSEGDIIEETFIHDVTRCVETAEQILDMLCKYSVTPCSVRDILEDIL